MVSKSGITFQIVLLLRRLLALRRLNILIEEYLGANGKLNVEYLVNVTDRAKKLFGVKVPFTQSKYIYSYDVVVKAGIDFNKIKWSVNDKTITVEMPEAKILSCEVKTDSFKVYHEEESIFTKISLKDNNKSFEKLKATAKKDAKANGLLSNAEKNAKLL